MPVRQCQLQMAPGPVTDIMVRGRSPYSRNEAVMDRIYTDIDQAWAAQSGHDSGLNDENGRTDIVRYIDFINVIEMNN